MLFIMKKFVLAMLCLAVFSFAANAQTDVPVSAADTLNKAVTAADTVKSVATPAQPSDDSMVLFEEGANAAGAEDPSAAGDESTPVDPKNIGLHRFLDGMKLDGMQLTKEQQMDILAELSAADGEDYISQWEKYRKGRGTGVGLIIAGSSLAAAGGAVVVGSGLVFVACVIWVALGGQEAVDNFSRQFAPWFISGAIGVGAGAAVAAVGIPITVSNCKKMNAITDRYNQPRTASSPVLTFGTTRSGIGLALNF